MSKTPGEVGVAAAWRSIVAALPAVVAYIESQHLNLPTWARVLLGIVSAMIAKGIFSAATAKDVTVAKS